MPAKVTVMKFGGTSIEDQAAFERVAQIVASDKSERTVVVVSAMSRVTDALLSSLQMAAQGEIKTALDSIDEHLERHLQVASGLRASARADATLLIESVRREIGDLLNAVSFSRKPSARLQDNIASYGERLSACLLAAVLAERGLPASYVDARRCITTDEEHGKANPLPGLTTQRTCAALEPLLKAGRVPVMGGFIAATIRGVTTTLGRGSSDYTATLVSAALGASETQIWTDVNGVLTADPRLIKTARTVPLLSYGEAAELARFGAKVLHPKTIQPAAQHKIPVSIRNSRAPEKVGTLICARTEAAQGAVKAIAHQTGMTMVEVTSTPAFVANGFLHAIRRIAGRHQTALNIVATSEIGVSLASQETSALALIVDDLRQVGSVEVSSDRAIICCVGEGLQSAAGSASKIRSALRDVDSTLSWCSTSSNNFISVLDEAAVGTVISLLHHEIFENNAGIDERTDFRG
ncbi:MAG: aspartate kinase [Pyrinomonadaceae bacterium]|nr:aspartate kinase [Pyrinomonadaceae bacterium]